MNKLRTNISNIGLNKQNTKVTSKANCTSALSSSQQNLMFKPQQQQQLNTTDVLAAQSKKKRTALENISNVSTLFISLCLLYFRYSLSYSIKFKRPQMLRKKYQKNHASQIQHHFYRLEKKTVFWRLKN